MERTMDTVEALDHLNGHLLNWYDTTTLEPLHAYISTVDKPGEPPHRRRHRPRVDRHTRRPRHPSSRGSTGWRLRPVAPSRSLDAALLAELDRLLDDFPSAESRLGTTLIARTRAIVERAVAQAA